MTKNIEKCKFCCEEIEENSKIYIIYKIVVKTNRQVYIFPMQDMFKSLNTYCMAKGLHLSSSQIILLRQDIFEDFLKEKMFPEEVEMWFLMENECCPECWSKYIQNIPEK